MNNDLVKFYDHLTPGYIYKRVDLQQGSNSADYHIRKLIADGTLIRVHRGLYLYPKKTAFGNAPAEDAKLIKIFLNDGRFLLTSPNMYNALVGVGTTQLYNQMIVYNHKRHGRYKLGGRTYDFCKKAKFPLTLSKEFLLIDLLNNIEKLADDKEKVLSGA